MFGDLFGSAFGEVFAHELDKRVLTTKYEERIEKLKKKSRRLIDIAYNKAINDVLVKIGDSLNPDDKIKIAGLKRVVRDE